MPPRKKRVKRVVMQKQKQKQSVVVNINQQRKTVARPPMLRPLPPPPYLNPVFLPQQTDLSSIITAIKGLDKRQPEIVRDVARVDIGEELLNPLAERRQAGRRHAQSGLPSQEFYATLAEERLTRQKAKEFDLPRTIPERSVSAPELRAEEPAPTRSVKELVKEYNRRFVYSDARRVPVSNKTDNQLLDDLTSRGLSLEDLAIPVASAQPEVRRAEAVAIPKPYSPFSTQEAFTDIEAQYQTAPSYAEGEGGGFVPQQTTVATSNAPRSLYELSAEPIPKRAVVPKKTQSKLNFPPINE